MRENYLNNLKTGQLRKISKVLEVEFTGKPSKKFFVEKLMEFSYNKLIETFNNLP